MQYPREFREPGLRKKPDKWRWRDSCDVLYHTRDAPRALDCCGSPGCSFAPLLSGPLLFAVFAGGGRQPGEGRPVRLGRRDRLALAAIAGYRRWISARTGPRCRFTPTCSAYGSAAIGRYGLADGARLIGQRLARCRPGVPVGTPDPVP